MTDQATREAAADLIDGGIQVLRDKGRCKNRLVDDEGRVCLVEALGQAGKGSTEFAAEFSTAWGALSQTLGGGDPLNFNNLSSTTDEDVFVVMQRASASLRDGAL